MTKYHPQISLSDNVRSVVKGLPPLTVSHLLRKKVIFTVTETVVSRHILFKLFITITIIIIIIIIIFIIIIIIIIITIIIKFSRSQRILLRS